MKARVKRTGVITYGQTHKVAINVKNGQIWEVLEKTEFSVALKCGNVSTEMLIADYERYFEEVANE